MMTVHVLHYYHVLEHRVVHVTSRGMKRSTLVLNLCYVLLSVGDVKASWMVCGRCVSNREFRWKNKY